MLVGWTLGLWEGPPSSGDWFKLFLNVRLTDLGFCGASHAPYQTTWSIVTFVRFGAQFLVIEFV